MTATLSSPVYSPALKPLQDNPRLPALLRGEILLTTQSHTDWGAAVNARLYLPVERAIAWEQLTDYPQWVNYFPAITRSDVIHQDDVAGTRTIKRLYQVASKNFFLFTANADIYLKAVETRQQRVQFYLESGSFNDFYADLYLQDHGNGTLLSYFVQATPSIPVPSMFIQQAIQLDLPDNLKNMRRVLCR